MCIPPPHPLIIIFQRLVFDFGFRLHSARGTIRKFRKNFKKKDPFFVGLNFCFSRGENSFFSQLSAVDKNEQKVA
jgi:hypothetical protein